MCVCVCCERNLLDEADDSVGRCCFATAGLTISARLAYKCKQTCGQEGEEVELRGGQLRSEHHNSWARRHLRARARGHCTVRPRQECNERRSTLAWRNRTNKARGGRLAAAAAAQRAIGGQARSLARARPANLRHKPSGQPERANSVPRSVTLAECWTERQGLARRLPYACPKIELKALAAIASLWPSIGG